MAFKPILFNIEMVQAILDGRKTQTRRIVKGLDGLNVYHAEPTFEDAYDTPCSWDFFYGWSDNGAMFDATKPVKAPCSAGDLLWVRETWDNIPASPGGHFRMGGRYYYTFGSRSANASKSSIGGSIRSRTSSMTLSRFRGSVLISARRLLSTRTRLNGLEVLDVGRKRLPLATPESIAELEKDAPGFPMHELQCCYCRKRFKAHHLVNGKAACPHCGKEYLIMLHVCPECYDVLKGKNPRPQSPQPFRCPVCNGRGSTDNQPCHPCGGKGIVWYEGGTV